MTAAVGLLCGCTGGPPEATGDGGVATTASPKTLDLAGNGDQGRLAIFHGDSSVHVGDLWDKAKEAFPQPKGAYEIHDLPNRLPNNFEARGWDLPSGEGYGVILLDNRTALAMYQLEHVKEDTVQDFIRDQENVLRVPNETLTGRTLSYYFWFDGGTNRQTLMISELTTPAGINMTIALGDDNVLKALGISLADAKKAALRIDGSASAISAPSLLR